MQKVGFVILFFIINCQFNSLYADLLNLRADNFSDVNGNYTPTVNSGNLILDTHFCIASILNVKYIIKFTSANAQGKIFRTKNLLNKYISYTINFYPNPNPTGVSYSMDSDVINTNIIINLGLGLVSGLLPNCSINNVTARLTFLQNNLDTATAGNYSDVLTIVVYLQPI